MPHKHDIDQIRDALLAVRLQLESHLAHDASWRALRTAGLASVVAEHLGSDADEDNRRLHRKLLRNSRAYRAYTRLIEAVRILSETSARLATPDDAATSSDPAARTATDVDAAAEPKPRIKVKAVSLTLPIRAHRQM